MAAGYFPTVRFAGESSLWSMAAGVAASLIASWSGALVVAMMRRHGSAKDLGVMVMSAMLVRFVVVLALALAIALSGNVDRAVFLIWLGISYVVLLAADTQYAISSAPSNKKESV